MKKTQFLALFIQLEQKLKQLNGAEEKQLNFPALIQRLNRNKQIPSYKINDYKIIWDTRNKIYASHDQEMKIDKDTENILINCLNNTDLQ